MAADHSHDHVSHDHDDGGDVHVHISPSRFYRGIFGALVCLTIATVKVSYYDFGSANILIALVIATMDPYGHDDAVETMARAGIAAFSAAAPAFARADVSKSGSLRLAASSTRTSSANVRSSGAAGANFA